MQKQEKARPAKHRLAVDEDARGLERRLAPLGSPVEDALAAAIAASGPPSLGDLYATYSEIPHYDSFTPIALRLARKFMRPDEQILGATEGNAMRSGHEYESRARAQRFSIVVFTHGCAVKIKGREFRTEVKPTFSTRDLRYEPWTGSVVKGHEVTWRGPGNGYQETATLDLGDLDVTPMYGRSVLFLPLYLQTKMRSRPAPKIPRASRKKSAARTRPTERLIRTARDAELVAADWMTYLGFTNVVPSHVGADGGVDVTSDEAVAQVKAESVPTGRPKIQQHHGVAVAHGKKAVFFSLAGYTPQARKYAEENGLILFAFDLQGQPEPVNPAAHALFDAAR